MKASAEWVLDADISGFFDNINHEWLLNHVHMDKVTLRKWLKSGVVDAGQLQRRPRVVMYSHHAAVSISPRTRARYADR